MADASTRLDDWHGGFLAHEVNEATASTRNDEVDQSTCMEQGGCGLVGGGQKNNGMGKGLLYDADRHAIGFVGILAAFQHAGVARLEAEGEDVEGNVGTRFIDHADDTEGHTDTLEVEAVRQHRMAEHATEGRR